MKRRTVLILAVIVIIVLVMTVVSLTSTEPQLSISRSDIRTGALSYVTNPVNIARLPDTNKTVEIWVRLNSEAATSFNKLLQDHPNHEIHIMDGTNVVARVTTYLVISKSELDLFFASDNEASVVCDALFKR